MEGSIGDWSSTDFTLLNAIVSLMIHTFSAADPDFPATGDFTQDMVTYLYETWQPASNPVVLKGVIHPMRL